LNFKTSFLDSNNDTVSVSTTEDFYKSLRSLSIYPNDLWQKRGVFLPSIDNKTFCNGHFRTNRIWYPKGLGF